MKTRIVLLLVVIAMTSGCAVNHKKIAEDLLRADPNFMMLEHEKGKSSHK